MSESAEDLPSQGSIRTVVSENEKHGTVRPGHGTDGLLEEALSHGQGSLRHQVWNPGLTIPGDRARPFLVEKKLQLEIVSVSWECRLNRGDRGSFCILSHNSPLLKYQNPGILSVVYF